MSGEGSPARPLEVGSGRVGAGLCAGPGGPGTASRTCGRCLRSAGLLRPREPGSALVDSGTCSCGLCRLHPPAEGPRPPRAPTAPAATLRAAPLLRLRLGPLFASRSWRSAKPGEGRSEGGGRAPAPRLDVRAHPSRAPSREAAGPEEERRGGLGLVLRPVRCVLSAERAGTRPPLTAGLGEMTRWCLRGKQGSTVCYLPRGRTQCGGRDGSLISRPLPQFPHLGMATPHELGCLGPVCRRGQGAHVVCCVWERDWRPLLG